MPNNISNIPEIREQTKSGILLIFFIFLEIKIPEFKKTTWKIPMKIGKRKEVESVRL